MAKKRPIKKHHQSIHKQIPPVQSLPPESKANRFRFILILAASITLVMALIALYFGLGSIRDIFSHSDAYNNSDTVIYGEGIPFPPIKQVSTDEDVQFNDFVGSDSCLLCHIEQYGRWRNSTHGRAGGEPGSMKIIARFDNQPLYFKDAVVIPTVIKSGEYIFKVKQNRLSEVVVKVDAVVGGGHIEGGGNQTFFTEFPDGTLRFVPFDYNKTDDVWFVQLKDLTWVPIGTEVSIHNLANWPPIRVLGTRDEFSNCQNCHGSQIMLGFDSQTQKYQTKFKTLQINCESCHGPGRRHIELMRTADLDTLTDIGIIVLSTVSKDESLNKCFECHAAKANLVDDFLPGKSLALHFGLKFPVLTGDRFFLDGRVRTFAYQQNHLFSDCYINGSMTCVDCHDPHSLAYRDINWKPLVGKFDDGQCIDCHPSKAKAPELHSHHKPDSPGNVCTACHMPFLQHPMLGSAVRFARSDHVISIPRPEFDARLGIKNACQQCHQDKSIAWQQEKTDRWYGKIKPHNQIIANNIIAKEIVDIDETAALLLNADSNFPMAQVTAIFEFTKRFLKPNMPSLSPEIVDRLKKLTESNDIDIESLALVALHLSSDHSKEIHQFLIEKLQTFGDQEIAIRHRWAFVMDYIGTIFSLKRDYSTAVQAYQKSLQINPSDIYVLINLGVAYRNSGDYSHAITTFKHAVELKPTNAQVYFYLANVYARSQQKQEAIDALKAGLKYDPNNQNARQMLQQLQS